MTCPGCLATHLAALEFSTIPSVHAPWLRLHRAKGEAMPLTQPQIDQRVFTLYDEYCHGAIDRREFLARAGALGAAFLAMAQALLPDYARAQTISPTDKRIKAGYVTRSEEHTSELQPQSN